MPSIHIPIILTEKREAKAHFRRHTSFCSNEKARGALNVTQLGSTEDFSIFALYQNPGEKRLLMVASKFMKELWNKNSLLLLL